MAVEVWLGSDLLAVSFMDIAAESTSSVYAMFDPEHAERSLGIYTILREIEQARLLGKRFHYLGYCYTVSSVYDYKKGFGGLEIYDWGNCWVPMPEDFEWSRKVEVTDGM
jgi:arginyl-tRNA--protein-N-Asp/Glu arginylyltransferase